MNPVPERVISDIQAEREYQLTRGKERIFGVSGGWDFTFDDANTVHDWASYVNRYLVRAADNPEDARKSFIKVAALACAAIEAIDRNGACAKRHYDK